MYIVYFAPVPSLPLGLVVKGMLRYSKVRGSGNFLPLAYRKVTLVYTRAYTQLSGLRIYARIAHRQTQVISTRDRKIGHCFIPRDETIGSTPTSEDISLSLGSAAVFELIN